MRTRYTIGLFANNFIDANVLFVKRFKELANVSIITFTDPSKVYAAVMERFSGEVKEVYQHSTFNYDEKQAMFGVTIFVLKNKRIIEIGVDYTTLLFTGEHFGWAEALLAELANHRMEERLKIIGFSRPAAMN